MRLRFLLISILCALLPTAAGAQLISHHGVVKGGYDFWVYVPQERAAKDTTKLPLVLFLHGKSLSGTNLKMQVVRPETYDSDTATQIANHLLNKCTVVLNLEKTSKEASRRLIDFLTGVAYSIGGDLRNIATNAYVITPSNVDVENAKIRTTPRQPQPAEPEPEEPAAAGDFSDFN